MAIAEQLSGLSMRMLGMTATLPSEREKAKEICDNLHIKSLAERSDSSPDVKPYIQETKTEWVPVDLSSDMKIIQKIPQACVRPTLHRTSEKWTQTF